MCMDPRHGTGLCVWIPGMRLVCVYGSQGLGLVYMYGSRACDWFLSMDPGHGTSLCVWIPGMGLVNVYGSRAWD